MDATRAVALRLGRNRNAERKEREDMRTSNRIAGAPLAALLIGALPAQAQERWSDPTFMAAANVTVHRGIEGSRFSSHAPVMTGTFDTRRRGDRRHDRRH